MSPKLYSIIDVETTGGQPSNSKITDISIFITDGYEILDEFSSLVNPNMPIPPFITQLTGIDDEMVATAPSFEEIAESIIEITDNTTFVAHNVNFDFGMISGEFRRFGYQYEREKLCTVRLGRKYLPGYRSYGLGNICEELGIPIRGRHRARGDAEATVELFHLIMNASDGNPTLQNDKWIKNLPAHIHRSHVDNLPQGPGIYYLKNAQDHILELCATNNVRQTIIKFLQSNSKKSKALKSELHSIESDSFGWDLLAHLKAEDELGGLNTTKPLKANSYGLASRFDLFGYVNLMIEKSKSGETIATSFASIKEGKAYIQQICADHKLCDRLSGIEIDTGCKNLNCKGACRQMESSESYNNRVKNVLNGTQKKTSSYVMIQSRPTDEPRSFLLIENGELRGVGKLESIDAIEDIYKLRNIVIPQASTIVKMRIINKYRSSNKNDFLQINFDENKSAQL